MKFFNFKMEILYFSLLQTETIEDRVNYWSFISMTEYLDGNEAKNMELAKFKHEKWCAEQVLFRRMHFSRPIDF